MDLLKDILINIKALFPVMDGNRAFLIDFILQQRPLKLGSSQVCDRNTQKNYKNRNTELKKTGIAPIV